MPRWLSRGPVHRGSMPQRSESLGGVGGSIVDDNGSRPASRTQRSSPIAWLIACALAACAGSAEADLWGYLDEQGGAHFATERLDERYQIFFKGETNLDAAARANAANATAPAAGEDFSRSRMYQYVTRHPNVARFAPQIERAAKSSGLDPALVKAVIAVESAFEPSAVSPKGAM